MRLTMKAFCQPRPRRPLEIETDEQVRGEADAFPANKQEQNVARQDQDSHEEEEQVEETEIRA